MKKPKSAQGPLETRYRVMPNDLGLFVQMNNGRDFSITDLARIKVLVRAGIWRAMRTGDQSGHGG
ncbi:MAG: hypothetical protein QNJ78_07945 [Gammaproteobacteria bacterium]|nr:hypothetical protein [Gammaproteobacteria bacterium]